MSTIEVFCKNIITSEKRIITSLQNCICTNMIMQYRAGTESVDCDNEYIVLWDTIPSKTGSSDLVKQSDGRFKNIGNESMWCTIDCSLLVNANINESWYANIYKYDTDNVSRTTHAFMQTIAQNVDGAQSKSASSFIILAPEQSFGVTITPIGTTITIEEDLCFLTITCGTL